MFSLVFIIFLSFLMTSDSNVFRRAKRTSNTENRQSLDISATYCGKLCDSGAIDSITSLNLEKDEKNYVLIVRGLCSWNLDIKNPKDVSEYGHRHRFKFRSVEATFTLFDDIEKGLLYNLTALFTSGMSGEVFRFEGKESKQIWDGAVPLPDLKHDYTLPLDAVFELQNGMEKKIRVIQKDKFYTYDIKANKMVSGPEDVNKVYSIEPSKIGGIQAAFSLGNKIYFFTPEDFYVWTSNGANSGVIGPKQSTKSEFFMCGDIKPSIEPGPSGPSEPPPGPPEASELPSGPPEASEPPSGPPEASEPSPGPPGASKLPPGPPENSDNADAVPHTEQNGNPDTGGGAVTSKPKPHKNGINKVLISFKLLITILAFVILEKTLI